MKKSISNLILKSLLCLSLLLFTSRESYAVIESFASGAFIINMGVVPQTVANGLKPYALVYDLMRNQNVPVKWVISQTKLKDGTDFTYNGVAYKGGTFIIPVEYRNSSVDAIITSWTAQGVVGTTTTSPLTVDVTYTLTGIPRWTINSVNGSIGEAFLTSAGITNTKFPGAYNYNAVATLSSCDDMFVMPHADPTWATHNRLYTWNKDCLGAIWSGCHAASALENSINPANPAQQMNFLTTRTTATTPTPWPNNSLNLWSNHNGGTPPYINRLPNDPLSQYMGITDGAQQNGSEQIYMPVPNTTARWRPGTKIMVYDPTQSDVPNVLPDLSNAAATVVYGQGFDSTNRGYVMYEAAHNVGGTSAASVAAVRIFFNFSYFQQIPKAPQITLTGISNGLVIPGTNVISNLQASATSPLSGTTFTYQWISSCGGTFSSPNGTTTNFTAPNVGILTNCVISCKVTDNCGRSSFTSVPIVITPPPVPPVAVNDTINISNGCNPGAVSVNVLSNDYDPQSSPLTFDSLITSTMNPANAGVWSVLGNVVTFTPNANFSGTATIDYHIHNSLGGTGIATIIVNNGSVDANGCLPNSVYAPQDIAYMDLGNFISTTGTGAVLNGTALDDQEDSYTTAATDYLNFGTSSANNLILSIGQTLRFKDSINLYWSKGTAGSAATLSVQIGQSATGPWTNTQTFTIPASPSGTGTSVSTQSIYALPSGTSGITHIRISAGTPSPATNSAAQVWLDAVEYEYLSCVSKNPNATDDETTILEDVPTVIDVLADDDDPQGLALTVKKITVAPSIGKVSINTDGTITYVNNTDVSGVDSFYYQVCNSENRCSEAMVKVNITNDGCGANTYKPVLGGGAVTKIFQYQYAGTNAATANSTSTKFRDAYLNKENANSNYGSNNKIEIGKESGSKGRRSVYYFDLSEIPSTATVQSASFSILRVGGDAGTTLSIGAHPLNVGFVENQVTWNISSTGNNWVPVGGNFGSAVSTVNVTSSNIRSNWSISSLVQSWVNTSANNFGLLLKSASTLDKRHQFATKENTTVANRPSLTVTYVTPAPCQAISNRAPFANPDIATTTSTIPVTVPVLLNDNDVDGNTLNLVSVISTTHGSSIVSGNNVIFTPTSGYNGEAKVTYRMSDGILFDTAIVYINVTNSAPIAVNDFPAGVNSGLSQNVNVGTNDFDPEGTAITFALLVNGTNGTATMTGSNMTYTPNADFSGVDTVYYEITEVAGGCSSGLKDTAFVVFTILNQPPTTNPPVMDFGLACSKMRINLVNISSDPENGVLTITNLGGLTPPSAGSLSNNNDGTVTFVPATGFTGNVSFTYTVTDNGVPAQTSALATYNINISLASNTAPVAVSDSGDSLFNDEVLYLDILNNDYDPENNPLSLPLITIQPLHGTATILSNGLLKYVPIPGYSGKDSLSYKICDSVYNASCDLSQGLCGTATVVYFNVKDEPEMNANPDINQTIVNIPVSGTVATNDNVIPGSTFSLFGSMSHGNLLFNSNGTYTYTPNTGFVGRDSVQYIVCSPSPANLCDTTTLTIVVTPLYSNMGNTVIAQDDHATTPLNTTVSICVLCNDSDPNGNTISNPTIIGSPSHGTIVINPNGRVSYTPSSDYFGTDVFTYAICDNGSPIACDTADVYIDIPYISVLLNQTYANDDAYSTTVNTAVNNTVATNDTDPQNDAVTFTLVSGPGNGSLTLNTNGSFTYTPNTNYVGPDKFVYSKCDNGTPMACDTATAYVTINNVRQDANPDINQTIVNIPVSGTVATNDNVIPGSTFSLLGSMSHGTLQFNTNGTYTYTPTTGFVGRDSVKYIVCSPLPVNRCDTTTLTIVVTPLYSGLSNTVIAQDDHATTPLNTTVSICVLCNDSDPNGNNISNPTIIGSPSHGTIVINPNGTISYTPTTGYIGTDVFTYAICDNGSPVACDTADVYIDVMNIPVLNNQTYANDDAYSTTVNTAVNNTVATNDTDPQNDAVSFTLVDGPANGSLTLNSNGSFTYTPNTNYVGPDQFIYSKCDNGTPMACDTATAYITINNVRQDANPDINQTIVNIPVSGTVATNDHVLPGSIFSVFGSMSHGTLQFNTDGSYTYTPTTGFVGRDSVQYIVCSPLPVNRCDTTTLTIVVTPLYSGLSNTVIAQDDHATTPLNTPVSICVLCNDSDPNGNTISNPTIIGLPVHGTIVTNPNGTITYTPNTGYNGTDVFTYAICDNGNPVACDTADVYIDIPSILVLNNQTYANDDAYSTTVNTAVNNTVATNDTDPQNDAVSFTLVDGPANGSLTLNSNGSFIYTPNTNYVGPDQFIYSKCDNGTPMACDTATAYITINNVRQDANPDINQTIVNIPVSGTVATNDHVLPGSIFSVFGSMSHGTLQFNSNGSYTYTPTTGFVGRDSVKYIVCSPLPVNRCDTTTLTIVVTPLYSGLSNTVIAQDDHATTPLNTPVSICVLCNDSDPNGNTISNPTIIGSPSHGTIVINPNGTISYTPTTGYTGTDVFTYAICDNGSPVACDTADVYVDIPNVPVTDNQTYANDDAYSTTVNTAVNNTVATNDTDPQNDAVTFTLVSGPGNGSLTLNTNGSFTYTPNTNYVGPDKFVYSKCDNGTPMACDTATAYITINNVRQDANPDINQTIVNIPVSGTVATNDNVIPGSTFSLLGSMSHGTLQFNTNGTYTYTPTTGFVGRDSVKYIVCSPLPVNRCDTTTLTIVVTPLYYNVGNTIIAQDDHATTPLNTPVSICVLCNDSDPNGNTISNPTIIGSPSHGTIVINPNGTISYTPTTGYIGTDVFTYAICDNGSPIACDTADVYIDIPNVPVTDNQTYANDDAYSTKVNTAVNNTVATNDTDPQNDVVTFTLVSGPGNGSLTLNTNGSFTYTPNTNYVGPDKFVYSKCDNGSPMACDTATAYITVNGFFGTPLPIVLNDFTATLEGSCNIHLNWSTRSEMNTNYFAIMRKSETDFDYKEIAKVTAAGNSTSLKQYQYTDNNVIRGLYQYQLKVVDIDGNESTTPVASVQVNCDIQNGIDIYPNPTQDELFITIRTEEPGSYETRVTDMTGRVVLKQKFEVTDKVQTETIHMGHLANGAYQVTVMSEFGHNVFQVLKNK